MQDKDIVYNNKIIKILIIFSRSIYVTFLSIWLLKIIIYNNDVEEKTYLLIIYLNNMMFEMKQKLDV